MFVQPRKVLRLRSLFTARTTVNICTGQYVGEIKMRRLFGFPVTDGFSRNLLLQ